MKSLPALASTLSVLLTCAFPTSLAAAETFKLHVHGFSADGSKFIFEEYGVQDGSGIPHASLYVINVSTDAYLSGSPIRTKFTEEDAHKLETSQPEDFIAAGEAMARQQLQELSADLMATIGPIKAGAVRAQHSPFQLNASNPIRFSTVGYQLNYSATEATKAWSLEIQPIEFEAKSSACEGWREFEYGFRLILTNEKTEKEMILSEDSKVPSSRGCPQNYHIEQVLTHGPDNNMSMAVVVRYASRGFEGYDGKILAVTSKVSP